MNVFSTNVYPWKHIAGKCLHGAFRGIIFSGNKGSTRKVIVPASLQGCAMKSEQQKSASEHLTILGPWAGLKLKKLHRSSLISHHVLLASQRSLVFLDLIYYSKLVIVTSSIAQVSFFLFITFTLTGLKLFYIGRSSQKAGWPRTRTQNKSIMSAAQLTTRSIPQRRQSCCWSQTWATNFPISN